MKRKGLHRPSIEDLVELSGIETLHPGGMALTRRTAEVAGLEPAMRILDVSSGQGTQALFYAREFGVRVTGVDLSPRMIAAAQEKTALAGLARRIKFIPGDSQKLPLEDNKFDAVINECAVGIPDDSQAVLNEMVRVAKPGGAIVIHESTWKTNLSQEEKDELSERYGTTPLAQQEWRDMLQKAGVAEVQMECEPWSRPEMFWNIRLDRAVEGPGKVLAPAERLMTVLRVLGRFGPSGVFKALANEKKFYQAVLAGKLGYCLYWGKKPKPEKPG